MRTKLTVNGDDVGIVIDRSTRERLDINMETEVELTIEGTRLVIESVEARRARIHAAAERVMATHAQTFRRLAE